MEDFAEKLTNPEFTGNADHWTLVGFVYNSNNIKIVELGAEKITNPNFTGSAAGWVLEDQWYWITGENLVYYNYTNVVGKKVYQPIANMVSSFVVGETYRVTFYYDKTAWTQFKINCGGVLLGTILSTSPLTGNLIYTFTCTDANAYLSFELLANGLYGGVGRNWSGLKIDTVSLKRVFIPSSVSQAIVEMVSPITIGNKEEITIVISGYVKGNVLVTCGGVTIATLSSNGTHVSNFLVIDDTKPVIISSSVVTELVIESVSLKRYASKIKAYKNGSFQLKPIKIYKTDTFINCVLRKFNGVDFEDA